MRYTSNETQPSIASPAGPYTYVWVNALVQRLREGRTAGSRTSPWFWPPGEGCGQREALRRNVITAEPKAARSLWGSLAARTFFGTGEVEAGGVLAGMHTVGVSDEIVTCRNDRRASILSGALMEACMLVSNVEDASAARTEAIGVVERLLQGRLVAPAEPVIDAKKCRSSRWLHGGLTESADLARSAD